MVRVRKKYVANSSQKAETIHHGGDSSTLLSSQTRRDPKRTKEFQGKLSHSSPPITRSCSSTHDTEKKIQQVTNACLVSTTTFPSPVTILKQESEPEPDNEVEIVDEIIWQSQKMKPMFNSLQTPRLSSTNKVDLKNISLEPNSKVGLVFKEDAGLYDVDQKLPHTIIGLSALDVPSFKTETSLEESLPRPAGPVKVDDIETSIEPDGSVLSTGGINEKMVCQTPHKIQICNKELIQSPSTTLSSLHSLSIANTPKKAVKSSRKLHPSQVSNQQVALKSSRPKPAEIMKQVIAKNHKIDEYYPIVRRSNRKTKRTIFEEKQLELEQAIKEEREDGLEVHNFEGKGRGVVTTRSFSKGEFVVEYTGELIDLGEAKLRETLYTQDQNTGCYMYYFKHRNHQYCIDATSESGRLGRLVNHSRTNGNLITKTVPVGSKPHLVLLAKEDIQVGEEIMYDYGDRSKESLRYHPWLNC